MEKRVVVLTGLLASFLLMFIPIDWNLSYEFVNFFKYLFFYIGMIFYLILSIYSIKEAVISLLSKYNN